MPTDTRRSDGTVATRFYGAEKSDESIAGAMDKARLSSTAGAGLGSKGKALTGAPKQEPNESPQSFGERMRKWREVQAQQKAFGGK
jgi:hypothetical protein